MARRAPNTGSIIVRRDGNGQETYYGKWSVDGRQVKRRIGARRAAGSRDGFTRAQAEGELRKLMAETKVMPVTKGNALTIAELGEKYIADLRRRKLKESTVIAVSSALDVHLIPYFAGKSIASVRPEDVEDLIAKMERDGLAPKSIRNYIGTLSALYNYARGPRRQWAARNPCEGVDLPEIVPPDEIRYLELPEVDALISAACEGAYEALDRALYLTAAQTGLRQGELIALRWKDVDWKIGKIRVRRTYSNKRDKAGTLVGFTAPKTERSKRSVPLSDEVAGELDRLCKIARWTGDDDLVFADPHTGGPLQCAAVLRRYRRALKAANLDETHRFHDLRHTFGTRMAAAGVKMRTLQEWMGHRDPATTQIYADYSPDPQEAQLVAAAFTRTLPTANQERMPA